MTTSPQTGTVEEATHLRAALKAAGYLLGPIAEALDLEDETEAIRSFPLARAKAGTDPRLVTLIAWFLSGEAMDPAEVCEAMGGMSEKRLRELGLATGGPASNPGMLRAAVRLQPWSAPGGEDIWLLTDQPACNHDLEDDYVLSISQSALLLERFTIRRQFERVLDMGAGSGLHALLAARDASAVVATDVIGRALDMCRWNAWLNGLENIETRVGSLYEPVTDETFDLVLSNPPFVVSPGKQWAYRDGGLSGDGFSREAVRGAASHLAEGGIGMVEVNWIIENMKDTEARLGQWCEGLGCDVVVLRRHITSPRQYAVVWSAPNRGDDLDAYRAELQRWMDTFEHRGVVGIGGGVVVLRKRMVEPGINGDSGSGNWMVTFDSPSPGVGSGEVVERLLAAHTRLNDGRPLGSEILVATEHSVEETLLPDKASSRYATASATVRLHPPLRFTMEADRLDLEILVRCEGTTPLTEIAAMVARAHKVEDPGFVDVVEQRARVLMGLGFLRVA